MDLLDAAIVLLIAALAVSGYRRGLTWGGLSMIGLILGSVVGAVVAPPLTRLLSPHTGATSGRGSQPLVAAGIFLACLLIIQGVGTALGFRIRLATLRTRFATWDSVAGSVVGGLSVLFAAWFLGFTFADSSLGVVNDQIHGSAIERSLSAVAPQPPAFLAKVQQFLRNNELPNPFAGLNQGDLPPQSLPANASTPAVLAASRRVSRVIAYGCGGAEAGSAWPLGGDEMVTNAHVVAGSDRQEVDTPDGSIHPARVVRYNPNVDVAILYVPGSGLGALPMVSADPSTGSSGAVIGYPGGGPEAITPAAVRGTENAYGYNIYNDAYVNRKIVVVSANVIPGDSGGPLVNLNGEVVGVTFASSSVHPDEGYALSMSEISADVQAAKGQTAATSVDRCVTE